MRKYSLFVAFFLLLQTVISFLYAPNAFAQVVADGACMADETTNLDDACPPRPRQTGDCVNAARLKCNPGLRCIGNEDAQGFIRNGVCIVPQTLPQAKELTCSCLQSGGSAPNNGYTCTDNANGAIVPVLPNPLQPGNTTIAYCRADERCYTRQGADFDPRRSGGPHPYTNVPADYHLKGVSCTREEQAVCRCENPNQPGGGQGKNRIWCLPPGDPDEKQMATRTGGQQAREVGTFCDGDNLACNPNSGVADSFGIADDPFYSGDPLNPGPHAGAVLSGVRCGQPEVKCTCTGTPNVKGSGVNSVRCEMPGQQPAEGWCKDQRACVPDGRVNENDIDRLQDNLLNNGKSTNEAPYNDVDLIGVHCDDAKALDPPPLPPVPPPPCAPGKLVNEAVCTAFLTAFGEINTDSGAFLTQAFALALAASGAIAAFLIIRAGYTIMVSAGNAERVKEGRDQLVAAIVGLLFLIFAFVILEVLAVDILRLPDFTEQVPGPGANPGAPAPDHCNSCESAVACQNRGGTSRGALDCGIGQICCE